MAKKMMDLGLVPVMSGGVQVGEDLAVVNGDFVVTESTAMHMQELILNNKGEFKENPTICVGAFRYLDDDEGFNKLVSAISEQFTLDGMDVKSVALGANGVIESDAYYK